MFMIYNRSKRNPSISGSVHIVIKREAKWLVVFARPPCCFAFYIKVR